MKRFLWGALHRPYLSLPTLRFLLRSGAVAGAILVLTGAGLWAQPTAPELTLRQATSLALANNPQLKALTFDRALTQNSAKPVVAGIGPTVELKGQALVGYGNTRVETVNLGPPGSENAPLELDGIRHGIVLQPEASWLVYDGGRGQARLKQLRLADEAAGLALENAREQTIAGVTKTYLAAARLQRQLDLAAENIDLSNERLARIQRDAQFGQASSLRQLQAAVDLNTDSTAYRNLALEVDNLKRSLNQLMGRDPETNCSLSVPPNLRPRPLPYDSLQTELLANNEEIALAQQRIRNNEQALDLAGLAWKPNVQLYANINYLNQSDNANFLLENRNFGSEAGVRASYTLFDGGLRTIEKQNAKLRVEQSQANRENIESQLLTLLRQAHATYNNSRQQLAFEQQNLPLFELNFEKTSADYRLGQTDATALRAAQLNLNAAKTRIVLQRFSVMEAEVELLRLTGGLVR